MGTKRELDCRLIGVIHAEFWDTGVLMNHHIGNLFLLLGERERWLEEREEEGLVGL